MLSSVFRLVLVLIHGQTKEERGFGMKDKVLKVSLKEISITP